MLPLLLTLGLAAQFQITGLRETTPEPHQTDDPAIWINKKDPAKSLIFGTVKMAAPDGAIAVYNLQGARLQRIPNVDRPNNRQGRRATVDQISQNIQMISAG